MPHFKGLDTRNLQFLISNKNLPKKTCVLEIGLCDHCEYVFFYLSLIFWQYEMLFPWFMVKTGPKLGQNWAQTGHKLGQNRAKTYQKWKFTWNRSVWSLWVYSSITALFFDSVWDSVVSMIYGQNWAKTGPKLGQNSQNRAKTYQKWKITWNRSVWSLWVYSSITALFFDRVYEIECCCTLSTAWEFFASFTL